MGDWVVGVEAGASVASAGAALVAVGSHLREVRQRKQAWQIFSTVTSPEMTVDEWKAALNESVNRLSERRALA